MLKSQMTLYWIGVSKFNKGRIKFIRLVEVTTDELIENIHTIVVEDRRLEVSEIARQLEYQLNLGELFKITIFEWRSSLLGGCYIC